MKLNKVIFTVEGRLEIQEIRFTVLQKLSVPIIIGCEVLGFLDFEVGTKHAALRGYKIPREITQEGEEMPVDCVIDMKVKQAIVIDKGDVDYCTILSAELKEDVISSLPEGYFELTLQEENSLCVNYSWLQGHRGNFRTHIRVSHVGEL